MEGTAGEIAGLLDQVNRASAQMADLLVHAGLLPCVGRDFELARNEDTAPPSRCSAAGSRRMITA